MGTMAPGVCDICNTPYNEIHVYTIGYEGLTREVCTCTHCGKELMKQQLVVMEKTADPGVGADFNRSWGAARYGDGIPV